MHPTQWISQRPFRLALFCALTAPVAGAAQSTSGFATALALMMEGNVAAVAEASFPPSSYAGRDIEGVPHYTQRPFTVEERRLLRDHFGIEEPGRLYLTDSTAGAYLNYDTERDPGVGRLVRSYRVGAPSIRRPGETWEQLERRLRTMRPEDFPAAARIADTTLTSLDSVARPHFRRMLQAARRAGHRVRVVEAHRSPERQAYLLVLGGGRTFTATSLHSVGRAVDLFVGDGNLRNPRTRAKWIAFREWVATYDGGRFQLIGSPDRSWDWPHVELTERPQGFGSIEALLREARSAARSACCTPSGAAVHWSHDPARSRAAALPRAGSGGLAVRGNGASGGTAVSAR